MGNVTTGDAGTDAQVTNSGTAENAVLDFVIPRGETAKSITAQVLSAINPGSQSSEANTALTFPNNPLVSGTAITHQTGSPDVIINQPGIYQAVFHSTISAPSGASIPTTVSVQLYQNGTPVTGTTTRHTLTASNEIATISFNIPIQVTSAPVNLSVVIKESGINFSESTLTVGRLGD